MGPRIPYRKHHGICHSIAACITIADQDQSAVLPLYFRAASSTPTVLDDEHSIAPSSCLRDGLLASLPLSSPPSSPSPDQRREASSSSFHSFVTGAGTKRHMTTPLLEPERDVASISVSVAANTHIYPSRPLQRTHLPLPLLPQLPIEILTTLMRTMGNAQMENIITTRMR